ncbi:hypothetical protein H112_03990 [Trichophyton rubrum D6]|uniref:Uncharacterized protein n=2 Tax=Trichophyton TaxID=5550 RepID=A0A022W4E7_TRIRU|nr:hypothetical protein H100_03997 [Trichophyton rubrum MR850]EZF42413.1 hypothetical protein H102_03983 [Trichophyton rubrum CBS 100081]EZF53011.1 hypothetical protein H103_03997 [Trichophyton rubrum CBS 288.86]EZF63549.1 hypothetical protein H104_03983 [Trichophyton rubrum CBS 289.86]EZF74322.1 hypothetical protein H105_04012 [Trichophyton soudanense CBS 452.61]EZF84911.1 hypothetical protein H110_03990 [Trichophyton rubrum MR1448]EZF95656.1 hypothetical protein H113_04024 [Trichophyton rub
MSDFCGYNIKPGLKYESIACRPLARGGEGILDGIDAWQPLRSEPVVARFKLAGRSRRRLSVLNEEPRRGQVGVDTRRRSSHEQANRPAIQPTKSPDGRLQGAWKIQTSDSQEKPAKVTLLALLLPLVSWKILETQRSRGEDPAMCSFLEPPS